MILEGKIPAVVCRRSLLLPMLTVFLWFTAGCGIRHHQGGVPMGNDDKSLSAIAGRFRRAYETVGQRIPDDLAFETGRAVIARDLKREDLERLLGKPSRVLEGCRLPGTTVGISYLKAEDGVTLSYHTGLGTEMSFGIKSDGSVCGAWADGRDVK